jgi:hypothetical protein
MLIHVCIDQHPLIQVVNEEENLRVKISYDPVTRITSVVYSEVFQSKSER